MDLSATACARRHRVSNIAAFLSGGSCRYWTTSTEWRSIRPRHRTSPNRRAKDARPMTRQEMLDNLHSHTGEWDVIIIGGGATGVGTAIDAAARGYDTLLLEAIDFGKGTSSRS